MWTPRLDINERRLILDYTELVIIKPQMKRLTIFVILLTRYPNVK